MAELRVADEMTSEKFEEPTELRRCRKKPNCVSSQADAADKIHFIKPLLYSGRALEALEQLSAMVLALPRTRLKRATEKYRHFTFKSRLMGYVDDIEFLLDPDAAVIHVRSGSRVGGWDLGANRRRVESIRAAFREYNR